ncbi:beta/gamma crystallin domain-containing protein [Streptomyces sp. Ag109_O5-1]|uniref:beta/gamma crystallin domain-containing protein n=1 Tax=Streptomyces sp. Ag109_O5-1 TaxID=1938851 RepID=UPI0021A975DD|nr:beta/gamma crystallin domain-containing protein [Streptomyces sp. Ag109_O5-1]
MTEANALSAFEPALKGRLEKRCCGEATCSNGGSYQQSTDSFLPTSGRGRISMKQIAKRAALAAMTTLAVTASLTAVTATDAFATNQVDCGRSDFVQVTSHQAGHSDTDLCFANAGTISLPGNSWITRISTGDNRVQWFGDAAWQPADGINKWTVMTWPNHPGGVSASWIRIL